MTVNPATDHSRHHAFICFELKDDYNRQAINTQPLAWEEMPRRRGLNVGGINEIGFEISQSQSMPPGGGAYCSFD